MGRYEQMLSAFEDEVEKIASSKKMQKKGTIVKLSSKITGLRMFGTGAALGALGLHVGKKANNDRKLGRQIRLQQQGQ